MLSEVEIKEILQRCVYLIDNEKVPYGADHIYVETVRDTLLLVIDPDSIGDLLEDYEEL